MREHLTRRHCWTSGIRLSDAAIIEAPVSTKNNAKSQGPGMHQGKKGNQ
jgi:hypothetical protein